MNLAQIRLIRVKPVFRAVPIPLSRSPERWPGRCKTKSWPFRPLPRRRRRIQATPLSGRSPGIQLPNKASLRSSVPDPLSTTRSEYRAVSYGRSGSSCTSRTTAPYERTKLHRKRIDYREISRSGLKGEPRNYGIASLPGSTHTLLLPALDGSQFESPLACIQWLPFVASR